MKAILSTKYGLFQETIRLLHPIEGYDSRLEADKVFTTTREMVPIVMAATRAPFDKMTSYVTAILRALSTNVGHVAFYANSFVPQVASLAGGLQGIIDTAETNLDFIDSSERFSAADIQPTLNMISFLTQVPAVLHTANNEQLKTIGQLAPGRDLASMLVTSPLTSIENALNEWIMDAQKRINSFAPDIRTTDGKQVLHGYYRVHSKAETFMARSAV